MEFSRELLFFFSALGAFNGLVLGLYFILFSRPKIISNYFLGVLLLTLSIRIGKSVFLYFNPYLAGHFLQFGMSACVFIGPSIYFYLRTVLKPNDNHSDWAFHYIPLLICVLTVGILFPWEGHPDLWRKLFFTIYGIWLIYLLLSGWLIRPILQKALLGSKLKSMELWIVSIYLGNVSIWIAYNTVSYTSYILGALSFSFVFYLLILLLILTRKKDPGFMEARRKYKNKPIAEEEVARLTSKLNQLMEDKKVYTDANLKLPDLASELNTLPHTLSQLLNDNLQLSFSDYVNRYRIESAKGIIQSESNLKLEVIGYQCGFNSKSTFYSAFRKVCGMTPSQFKAQQKSS